MKKGEKIIQVATPDKDKLYVLTNKGRVFTRIYSSILGCSKWIEVKLP